MPGQLFTHYFLTDGIKATAEWKASVARPEAFAAFRDGVCQRYDALSRSADPNEVKKAVQKRWLGKSEQGG